MISAALIGGYLYCARPGCRVSWDGVDFFETFVVLAGWWDVDADVIKAREAGRRRIARHASRAVNDPPIVQNRVYLPAVIECPRCRARHRIEVASPSQ